MGLLTIGAFARETGLTAKALRLYDELGLLPPAAVDAESGYRLYDRQQLGRARLIAQLRRIGMPLAEIGVVCGLEPAAAGEAIGAWWRQVGAETTSRARLAALLVEHVSGRGTTMSDVDPALEVHSAAGCDRGAVRTSNEDAAHADDRLLAVADGVSGAGGAAAGNAAVDALRRLTLPDAAAVGVLGLLAEAVTAADRVIRATATDDAQPFTTLTALVRTGSQLALVHVGDSRAYLLRDGELHQLTTDHTVVQSLVDRGDLGPDELVAHPQRALLVRALGAGGQLVEADLALRTALPGDRYLLCTDGLWAVVPRGSLRNALTAGDGPAATVERLIGLARAAGAPDNVACVVADVLAG